MNDILNNPIFQNPIIASIISGLAVAAILEVVRRIFGGGRAREGISREEALRIKKKKRRRLILRLVISAFLGWVLGSVTAYLLGGQPSDPSYWLVAVWTIVVWVYLSRRSKE